jgi:hypothetical protein
MKLKIEGIELENGDIEIIRIKGLAYERLPKEYSYKEPNVQVSNSSPVKMYLEEVSDDGCRASETLTIGEVVSKAYFDKQVEYCKKAAARLKAINKMIRDSGKIKKESTQEQTGRRFIIEF